MDTAALAAIAAEHAGAFSTAHALSAGWTARQIRAARTEGRWRRLYEGAYVDAHLWESMDPKAQALCQLRARLLVLGDAWHAARGSALLVHELPLLGQPQAVPQLVRAPVTNADRAASRNERVAPLPPEDRDLVGGCKVTALARTVADHARERPFLDAVLVADAALHAGLAPADLDDVASRCARWPGAAKLRAVLAHADGRAESPFESLSRVRMLTMNIPRPELQVEIRHEGRFVARVDFLWRDHMLIGEADGRAKYTSTDDFYAEKLREQRLQDLGFELVRWDWDTAWHRPHELEAMIRRGLVRGRLNSLDPDVRLSPPLAA